MEIRNGQDDFYVNGGCAVTIGKFDGVHRGHQKLIKDVVSRAKVSGIKSCVITFDDTDFDKKAKEISETSEPEEKREVKPALTVFEEKKRLIEKLGIDLLVVFKLDDSLMLMNPYAFIDSVLMDKLNMQSVSIGPDFRFGHKREGKAMTFVKAAMIYGYGVYVIDKEESGDKPISSSRIRDLLSEGDIETVNEMLGREYSVTGITRSGDKIGRSIGFPTMNLYPCPNKLLPPNGVYSTDVLIGGRLYRAVTNVGVRPTVSEGKDIISVESHLLDFKAMGKEDYDKEISVSFKKKIRNEQRFGSKEELAEQIRKDISALD